MKPDYNKIYDILVASAGAREDDRISFVSLHESDTQKDTEYRFCGHLGFGGKFRQRWKDAPYVSCYPEDMTAERKVIIEKTNQLLKEVHALLHSAT